jgi:hypothetical protein
MIFTELSEAPTSRAHWDEKQFQSTRSLRGRFQAANR